MFKILFITFVTVLLSSFNTLKAQQYVCLDSYGTKRIRVDIGEGLIFKLKDDPIKYADVIMGFGGDSTIYLAQAKMPITLDRFEKIYFRRDGINFLQKGTTFVGTGFFFAWLVAPLVKNKQYDPVESLWIGGSILAISQSLRIFKWKKIKLGKRSRIRIMDMNFSVHE